jgi:hypothetical protein
MSAPLTRLLHQIAVDPEARRVFERDPEAAIAMAGLRGKAHEALINRDPAALQRAVLSEQGADLDTMRKQLESGASNDIDIVIV